MASFPLQDKLNLHIHAREMIYSEFSKGALTISKAKKVLEKVSTKVKHEKSNSKSIHLHNWGFKELVVKLGVDPNDKATIDAIIQGSHSEIQSLRHQLKMHASEHVQKKELA